MQLKYMHKCFYSWQSWYFGMKLSGECNLLGSVSSYILYTHIYTVFILKHLILALMYTVLFLISSSSLLVKESNWLVYVNSVFCNLATTVYQFQESFIKSLRFFYVDSHAICEQRQFYFFLPALTHFLPLFLSPLISRWVGFQ